MYDQIIAAGCLAWYVIVGAVTGTGTIQILRHFSRPTGKSTSSRLEDDLLPHVTIIRPCKGLEPFLYECLAAAFYQDYPASRFTVHFCVSSKSDAAYPILQQLVKDYSSFDTRIFIEDEDPLAQGENGGRLGPNPKVRNMSRAYREAKGDVIWIFDCNIWAGRGVLGRMVDKLCGFSSVSETGQKAQTKRPYKLLAHVPISVDVDGIPEHETRLRSASAADDTSAIPFFASKGSNTADPTNKVRTLTGSMLDAMFLATMHGKFFVGINTIHIAPCCNGKSAIFRKSHLDYATQNKGFDHFSHNICEDQLLADLLWKTRIPPMPASKDEQHKNELKKSNPNLLEYRNPDLVLGDVAIQPVAQMSITSYIARRIRWIRVRKYTVLVASLVEGITECFACSAMGAYGLTTLRSLQRWFGSSWSATAVCFTGLVLYWMTIDWFVTGVYQGLKCVENTDTQREKNVPNRDTSIALPAFVKTPERRVSTWLPAWFGRELLAGPIWVAAVCGGGTITWREKQFWVGMDMKVHEFQNSKNNGSESKKNGDIRSKDEKTE